MFSLMRGGFHRFAAIVTTLAFTATCPVALALVWKSSSILKETAAFSAVVIIFLMISEAWLNLGDSVPAVTFVH